MGRGSSASFKRLLSTFIAFVLIVALTPVGAFALRQGVTSITASDTNGSGKPDTWEVDWDGDGVPDERWVDSDGDGVIDSVEVLNTGGDATRSARGKPGMRVGQWPLSGGGTLTGVDWDGDGRYDECWWDYDGDGTVEDTDIYATESKVLDNTKSTRFRGVFVGVNNGLNYSEKDVDDLTGALEDYPASWDPADMNSLTGAAATPAAIQAAIEAAKAESKPGDEFVFYFSGHGGGYDKDTGLAGGLIDTNGDETAIQIPESEFGRFDGSKLPTAAAGRVRYYGYDLDGDGVEDTRVVKDSNGQVHVWRPNPNPPPPWVVAGSDTNGDGVVDAADGGVDMNGDGDKDDMVGIDDTLLVAGKAKVTDDQLTEWLSGFPESVTIVVIIDSCYSGSFIPDLKNGLKDSTGKPLRPGHLEVVTASAADSKAYEMPISNSVLTQGILNALIKLPDWLTGGHATSLADYVSADTDDRTTTRELFRWAGPNAVTYANLDNDGDGLRNEDGPVTVFDTSVEFDCDDDLSDPRGTEFLSHLEHDDVDNDGDGLVDEDPPAPPQSFFDVYYDPDFGGWPTPTFIQVFTGDDVLSATGMQPEFGVFSIGPLNPGTPTIPGPTLEAGIREVPMLSEPVPPDGSAFCGPVFDLTMCEVWQSHGLEEATDTVAPEMMREPMEGALPFPNLFGKLAPAEDANPGLPYYYDEGALEWLPLPILEIDPDTHAVTFSIHHLSKFAMIGPMPGRPADTTPPDDPWQLGAFVDGDDVTLTWRNPTDPDFSSSVALRSRIGYAADPFDLSVQFPVHHGHDPVAIDAGLNRGIYYYTVFALDHHSNPSGRATALAKVGKSYNTPVQGLDRYATAVAASKKAFPLPGSLSLDPEGYRSVVVATGLNWPDALGGSSLAGAVGGPVLLTGATLPPSVSAEIQRLGANRVLLLGGKAAVPDSVRNALVAVPGVTRVERIAGDDRYATAERVAARTVGILPAFDGTAIVATGRAFPDALAGSPLAASKGWPIYLSTDVGLRASTKSAMNADSVTDALVLGGTAAVPQSVVTYLSGALSGEVTRLSGPDRYSTAVRIAKHGVDRGGLRWDGVAVATGTNFPDALAGGVMQGLDGSVILLTRPDVLSSPSRSVLKDNAFRISEVRFLGGTAAVSQAVRNAVMAALQ